MNGFVIGFSLYVGANGTFPKIEMYSNETTMSLMKSGTTENIL